TRRRARTSCRPTPLPTPDTTAGCVASTVRRRACRRSPTARARASSARPPSCACGRRCVADAVENVVGPLDADTQLRDASLQRRTRQRAITLECRLDRAQRVEASLEAQTVLAHDTHEKVSIEVVAEEHRQRDLRADLVVLRFGERERTEPRPHRVPP